MPEPGEEESRGGGERRERVLGEEAPARQPLGPEVHAQLGGRRERGERPQERGVVVLADQPVAREVQARRHGDDAPAALEAVELVAGAQARRAQQVGVPVVAPRALAADDHEVAVQDRVVAGARDDPAAGGDEGRPALGEDVLALVAAAGAEPVAVAVTAEDREAVLVEAEPGAAAVGPDRRALAARIDPEGVLALPDIAPFPGPALPGDPLPLAGPHIAESEALLDLVTADPDNLDEHFPGLLAGQLEPEGHAALGPEDHPRAVELGVPDPRPRTLPGCRSGVLGRHRGSGRLGRLAGRLVLDGAGRGARVVGADEGDRNCDQGDAGDQALGDPELPSGRGCVVVQRSHPVLPRR